MVDKIVVKEPFNVIYEGRVLNRVVRVFEIRLLRRSGKPYVIYGKDINNPQKQAAPYDFEYLDWESQERVLEEVNKYADGEIIQYPQAT